MNTVWRKLKKLAKRNTAVRICMIGVYAIVFTLRALWRRRLRFRKKLAACLVVFSLCFFRVFAAAVYAETVSDAAAGSTETGTETETKTETETETETGTEPGNGNETETGTETGNGSETETGTETGNETGTGSDASGNEIGTGSDASGNEIGTGSREDAAVSNNDVSGNSQGNNDLSGNDLSGNDPENGGDDTAVTGDVSSNDISGNDLSGNDVSGNDVYAYSPQLFIDYRLNRDPAGVLTGNASSTIILSTVSSYIEPEEKDGVGLSPAVSVWEEINGGRTLIDLSSGRAELAFPSDFYGTITFTAQDSMGNTSTQTSPLLLIDASLPAAEITEELQADGSKRLTAVFKETSSAASGVGETRCFIDGAEVQMPDFTIGNVTENCFGRAVVSEKSAPVIIKQAGTYTVTLFVKDNAGNEASFERVVEMPEALPISISAPSRVGMTIDPYSSEGPQIYADVCTIENKSGYDVTALLRSITLTVDRGNVDGDASKKDCELFLSYGGAQDVALPEGNTTDFLDAVIPAKKEDGGNGTLTFRIYGKISKDSARYWRDGDIKLSLGLEYMPSDRLAVQK